MLLPRVSLLGLYGAVFNAIKLAPSKGVVASTFIVLCAGVCVPIALIVADALNGVENDFLVCPNLFKLRGLADWPLFSISQYLLLPALSHLSWS